LRQEVASPDGFAGLDVQRTGFGDWSELIAACRADGWALDVAAYDRPLFPGIGKFLFERTGKFLFTESFEVQRLCKQLIGTGRKLGFN